MANPIQQGLKHSTRAIVALLRVAAMANPIQQGLKHDLKARKAVVLARRNG